MINWHSQGSIYGTTIIRQVGLIFGRNWNGKQLDQVEKEYKGIFNNGMIAHSQGTMILRDDLETEEGRWNFNS